LNDFGFVFLKLGGHRFARRSGKMCFVVNRQWRYLADGACKQVFIRLCLSNGRRARSFLGNCFGLRRCNLLLNQFEILKRLEFHQPMVP